MYTLCEDNLVPWLCYSFAEISLSVCLFMCVYMMLVALSMCLRVGAGIVGGSWGSNDCNIFSSSVGMSIEWLTGVSQVVGTRPDVFSCELNSYQDVWDRSLLQKTKQGAMFQAGYRGSNFIVIPFPSTLFIIKMNKVWNLWLIIHSTTKHIVMWLIAGLFLKNYMLKISKHNLCMSTFVTWGSEAGLQQKFLSDSQIRCCQCKEYLTLQSKLFSA